MALYETIFIVRQDVSLNEIDKMIENYSDFISNNEGKICKKEDWGLRKLAYKVKKNSRGHYIMLGIDAPYATMKEMERRMKLNENILKNMIIKVDAINSEPSMMMNIKTYNDAEPASNDSVQTIKESEGE